MQKHLLVLSFSFSKYVLQPQAQFWEVEWADKHRQGLSADGTDPSRIIWSAQSSAQANKSWRKNSLTMSSLVPAKQHSWSQTWHFWIQLTQTQLGSAGHLGDLRSLMWVEAVWVSESKYVLPLNHEKLQDLPPWLFSDHRQQQKSQLCFFSWAELSVSSLNLPLSLSFPPKSCKGRGRLGWGDWRGRVQRKEAPAAGAVKCSQSNTAGRQKVSCHPSALLAVPYRGKVTL